MKPTLTSPIWSWMTLLLALVFIGWALWLIFTAHSLHQEVVRGFSWGHQLHKVERCLRNLEKGLPPPSDDIGSNPAPGNWKQLIEDADAEIRSLVLALNADPAVKGYAARITKAVRKLEAMQPEIEQVRDIGPARRRLVSEFRSELNEALDESENAILAIQLHQEALATALVGKWRALTMLVMVACVLAIFVALLSNTHLQEIAERSVVEERLKKYRDQLEELVEERTLEVARANEQLKEELSRRQLAENALRLSESRYRLISELTSDYIYSVRIEADGRLVTEWVTEAFQRTTGYTVEEVNALGGWLALIHPDDMPLAENFGRTLSARLASSLEYRIRTKQGLTRWLGDFARPEWDATEGRVVRVLGAVQDITERKLAEHALQKAHGELEQRVTERTTELVQANESLQREIAERRRAEDDLRRAELKYRSIFENAVEGIYQTTPDGRFLAANPALARMWGYSSPAELLSTLIDVEHQIYVDPQQRSIFKRVIEEQGYIQGFEYQTYRTDGAVIWVSEHAHVVRDAQGEVLYYEGTIQDITERKRAEEALRASEAKYRSLIENLEQCIFLKDRELRFITANPPFCALAGRTENELIGKTDRDLFPPELAARFAEVDQLVLRDGKPIDTEEVVSEHGNTKQFRAVRSPVRDANGQVAGVLGIFWDVTEQKALEAQLRQSQKMEAIGRLAGGVAHDFNNLLTIILGNLSLTLSSLPEGSEMRESLAIAEQAAVRAAELTRQLLGFSRRAILRTELFSLNLAVHETLNILRRTIDPRIAIEVRTEEHLWPVRADRAQIGQVLMNLCLNARDAMPSGGRLILETSNVTLDEDYVRWHLGSRKGDFVRLRVQDTGHGIAPEVRAQIFEPFFTTKAPGKGTGLGLAMVFGIVKQHQGWIDCNSEVGAGAVFDIYIPRDNGEVESSAQTSNVNGAQGGQETILLVDDEEQIRSLGMLALQRYGYRVLLAEDGLQAIDTYLRQKGRIHLIVLDLTMPHLSGRDTLAELVKYDPHVPVLISSGYSAESLTPAESDHILGFVGKPYRPEELASAVRAAIDQARERRLQHAAPI